MTKRSQILILTRNKKYVCTSTFHTYFILIDLTYFKYFFFIITNKSISFFFFFFFFENIELLLMKFNEHIVLKNYRKKL
jgi:hypothetical protein